MVVDEKVKSIRIYGILFFLVVTLITVRAFPEITVDDLLVETTPTTPVSLYSQLPTQPFLADEVPIPSYITLKLPDGSLIQIKEAVLEGIAKEQWAEFTHEQKRSFLEHKNLFLTRTTQLLLFKKVIPSFGIVTQDELLSASAQAKEVAPPSPRNDKVWWRTKVSALLTNLNNTLWSNLSVLMRSNETGLTGSIGIIAESGVGQKGRGGLWSIGINLSYNKIEKSLGFEIFVDVEKYRNAMTPTLNIAVTWDLGVYRAYRSPGSKIRVENGASYYPPGIFGVTSLDNSFSFSYTDSPIGFPSYLATVMIYNNSVKRHTLLRTSVSPLKPGFFRASGSLSILKEISLTVRGLTTWLKNRVLKRTRSCLSIFG
jgi:hypothetical protein